MAKRFVRISLATKFRLLLGAAVLGIIAAALMVPWIFMELLAEQGVQKPAAELTRLQLNEWRIWHQGERKPNNTVSNLYTAGGAQGRQGPRLIKFTRGQADYATLDDPEKDALKAFRRNRDQEMAVIRTQEKQQTVYRCFRAVRSKPACAECHESRTKKRFRAEQLVGMISVTMPASAATGPLVWWTRGAFVTGVLLAGLLAFFLFAIITNRLILRPVKQLHDLTDRVAEGDLTARSEIRTRDELQDLGESINGMLDAIADQHDQLRSANRALDQKLGELAEANVTLFQANKVKTEFLANVSHELRTPLNSIIGFADLLAETGEDRIQRYGRNIGTSAKGLLGLINDILNLARIEAGKAEVRPDKMSVTDTCQTLLALMAPLADKKQIELAHDLAGDLPLVVTDASKFQQILYNLLSNAIKFTPAGGKVTMTARTERAAHTDNGNEEVIVAVADTGPGIAELDQRHIFEKFYQGDRSLTKESGGTGLGLAIAKELSNLLGGRLTLKSSPGRGAVFTIRIPVRPTGWDDADAQ